jgi:hypothetical protein
MNRFTLALVATLVLPTSAFATDDCGPKTAAEILEGQWAMTSMSAEGLEDKVIWTFIMSAHAIRQVVAETPDGVSMLTLLKSQVSDNGFTMRTESEHKIGYADMTFAALAPDQITGTYTITNTQDGEHEVEHGKLLLTKLHPNKE